MYLFLDEDTNGILQSLPNVGKVNTTCLGRMLLILPKYSNLLSVFIFEKAKP
jgi:hypothetical protein